MSEQTTQTSSTNPSAGKSGPMIGLLIAVVVIIIAIMAFMFMRNGDEKAMEDTNEAAELQMEESIDNDAMMNETEATQNTNNEAELNVNTNVSVPEMIENETKEFTVSGNNYAFDLKEIKVKKGDTVAITFKNEVGNHDLLIDEFDVDTDLVPAGQSKKVTFVASKAGSFEYYCSVGQHRQMGMKGTLIVE